MTMQREMEGTTVYPVLAMCFSQAVSANPQIPMGWGECESLILQARDCGSERQGGLFKVMMIIVNFYFIIIF